ncbi:VanZ family protein [Lysinibacter cavernae]|uniref:Glycopeptide antibiotics resistance protein n=1 Tax=Lysinibacter cavernae TaxID=1640652 RepID=A0A7X5R0M3_9MICO|nr:VanZ family protein [Lysinibacter cavernae]NIH53419.1 glycopeptide antibiotics resistance protein [Lysinibacter cavernae]
MFHRHPILSLLTLGYLAVVGWITLGPQPLDDNSVGFVWQAIAFFDRYEATAWIGYNEAEFMANIAMFVPIGLFFLLLFGRRFWWLSIILSCLLTVGIETAQLVIPGRVSDPRDLVANSAGAVLGVVLGLVLTIGERRKIAARSTQRARLASLA